MDYPVIRAFPDVVDRARAGFWFFRLYDGPAITVRPFHHAGDQRGLPGRAQQAPVAQITPFAELSRTPLAAAGLPPEPWKSLNLRPESGHSC